MHAKLSYGTIAVVTAIANCKSIINYSYRYS